MQLQILLLHGARPPAAARALHGDGVRCPLARQVLALPARQVFLQEQESRDLLRSVPYGEVKL